MSAGGRDGVTTRSNIDLSIEGNQYELRWCGFTSQLNRHRHFMKHVARINETNPNENNDAERWYKLWPAQPPLASDVQQRRTEFTGMLKSVEPPCALATRAPSKDDRCSQCLSNKAGRRAFQSVESVLKPWFDSYENLLADSVIASVSGEGHQRPLIYIEKPFDRDELEMRTLSLNRVFVVGIIPPARNELRIVTGYVPTRSCRPIPFAEMEFDFRITKRRAKVLGSIVECKGTEGVSLASPETNQ